jgi:hypothetical protein
MPTQTHAKISAAVFPPDVDVVSVVMSCSRSYTVASCRLVA